MTEIEQKIKRLRELEKKLTEQLNVEEELNGVLDVIEALPVSLDVNAFNYLHDKLLEMRGNVYEELQLYRGTYYIQLNEKGYNDSIWLSDHEDRSLCLYGHNYKTRDDKLNVLRDYPIDELIAAKKKILEFLDLCGEILSEAVK